MKSVILALGVLSACADAPPSAIRVRAANDLNCPEPSIVVTNAGSGATEVAGCGRRAKYVCTATDACIRDETDDS